MELELSTPALLFSAITLMMLAFTNRFLAIANLIRGLHERHRENPDEGGGAIKKPEKEGVYDQKHADFRGVKLSFMCGLYVFYLL